uniref:ATP-dependent DNA helicase PIF1 n=1 Tax=Strongyloides venezuelensis TaxID=75913 RepID=A0A0K0FW55_STRVS
MGTIKELRYTIPQREQLNLLTLLDVLVEFGNNIGEHLRKVQEIQFDDIRSTGYVKRRMVPLILCWATTVHKLQGKSLFVAAHANASLSRVRSLESVHIEDIAASKLVGPNVCDKNALNELERLRYLPPYREDS